MSVPADINVHICLCILFTKKQPVCYIWSKFPLFRIFVHCICCIRGLTKLKVKFHYLIRNPVQQVNLILAVGTISVIWRFCGFTKIWEAFSGKSVMLNDGRRESKIKINTWIGHGFQKWSSDCIFWVVSVRVRICVKCQMRTFTIFLSVNLV